MTDRMPQRSDYRHFQPIITRWHDNDVYGHVNNVTDYSFFDTAVNTYMNEVGGLEVRVVGALGHQRRFLKLDGQ